MSRDTGFYWAESPAQMLAPLIAQIAARRDLIILQMDKRAVEIEDWMKQNAPWTDRTGEARRTLRAEVVSAGGTISILVAYSVYYGTALEYDYGGQYAVLGPALDYWWPILIEDIQKIMRG